MFKKGKNYGFINILKSIVSKLKQKKFVPEDSKGTHYITKRSIKKPS